MRKLLLIMAMVCALAGVAQAQVTTIANYPMDVQVGTDGIFCMNNTPPNYISFEPAALPAEPDGFTRMHIVQGNTYYYGPYIDFVRTGLGEVDISDTSKLYRIEVHMRYYQEHPRTPRDANSWLRVYQMGTDGTTVIGYRSYDAFIYQQSAPLNDPAYPAWSHKVIELNCNPLRTYTDTTFPGKFNRLRFYCTDWDGTGNDYVDVKKFVLTVESVGKVTGVVNDTRGNLVSGATVTASTGRTTTTAADGTYTLWGTSVGNNDITVTSPLYATQTKTGVSVTAGGSIAANFTLYPVSGFVSGYVKDASGNPIAGAYVGVKKAAYAAADADQYITTDAAGKYRVQLANGSYYFAAWKFGRMASTDATVTVLGEDRVMPDLILDTVGNNLATAPGASASATNEDPGNPAANAVDDNIGSRWITGNPLADTAQDQSYIISLGGSKEVTGLAIDMENARPSDYTVDVTNDPSPSMSSTWTTIYSVTGSKGGVPFNGHFQPMRFSPHKTITGVRYHVTKFGPYPVYSVWEFSVYGTGAGSVFDKISDIKDLPDGSKVQLVKPVIFSDQWDSGASAVFTNRFWMEEADRSNGIRIDMVNHYCWAGELDWVKGTVQTDSATGERYIAGEATAWPGAANVKFAPFAMANRNLDSKTAWGKMVKTWGTVTELLTTTDPNSGETIPAGYKLSDGSGDPVTVVAEGNQLQVGSFTTVTGMLTGGKTIYAGRKGDGTIRSWLVHGGYSVDQPADDDAQHAAWQQANLDQDFLSGETTVEPKPGDVGPNGDKWFVTSINGPDFVSAKDADVPWQMYMDTLPFKPSGKGESCAYASTWVYADREYSGSYDNLTFKVGSDDGYKLWLNGKLINTVNLWRACTRDSDIINNLDPMTGGDLYVLKPGWNHIMVKSNNITGGWGFTFRMTFADGIMPLNLPTSVVPWGAPAL